MSGNIPQTPVNLAAYRAAPETLDISAVREQNRYLLDRWIWSAGVADALADLLRSKRIYALLTEDEQAAFRDITRPYVGPPVTRRGH